MLPLDLHVLSLPLAFILSQDQTLHSKFLLKITRKSNPLFCPSLVRLTFLSASSPAVSMNFWQPELPYFSTYLLGGLQRYILLFTCASNG